MPRLIRCDNVMSSGLWGIGIANDDQAHRSALFTRSIRRLIRNRDGGGTSWSRFRDRCSVRRRHRQPPVFTPCDFQEIDEIATTSLKESTGEMDLKKISRKAAAVAEKSMIKKALHKTKWNRWKAAKELKVSYKTLLTKIEQYQIRPST